MSEHVNATRTTIKHDLTGVLGDVADMLISMESRWEADGWNNQQPCFWRISRVPDTLRYQLDACRLGGMTHPGAQPREDLYRLARAAQHPEWVLRMRSEFPVPPVTHMMLFEAWVRLAQTEEADPTSSSGRLEGRAGIALVGNRTLKVGRLRHEEPELVVDGKDTTIGGGQYGLFQSLKDLHAASMQAYRVVDKPDQIGENALREEQVAGRSIA